MKHKFPIENIFYLIVIFSHNTMPLNFMNANNAEQDSKEATMLRHHVSTAARPSVPGPNSRFKK